MKKIYTLLAGLLALPLLASCGNNTVIEIKEREHIDDLHLNEIIGTATVYVVFDMSKTKLDGADVTNLELISDKTEGFTYSLASYSKENPEKNQWQITFSQVGDYTVKAKLNGKESNSITYHVSDKHTLDLKYEYPKATNYRFTTVDEDGDAQESYRVGDTYLRVGFRRTTYFEKNAQGTYDEYYKDSENEWNKENEPATYNQVMRVLFGSLTPNTSGCIYSEKATGTYEVDVKDSSGTSKKSFPVTSYRYSMLLNPFESVCRYYKGEDFALCLNTKNATPSGIRETILSAIDYTITELPEKPTKA